MYKRYLIDFRITQGHKQNDYYKTHTSFSAGCFWYTNLLSTDVVDSLNDTSQTIHNERIHGLLQSFLQVSHLVIWDPPFWVISSHCVFLINKVLIIQPSTTIQIQHISLLLHITTYFSSPDQPSSGGCWMNKKNIQGERPVCMVVQIITILFLRYNQCETVI